jgi:very-short-patch-repair endonuclease
MFLEQKEAFSSANISISEILFFAHEDDYRFDAADAFSMFHEDAKRHRAKRQQLAFVKKLRKSMTIAERKLWHVLRNRELAGIKFKRQVPIGPFIADFYCAEYKLVLEVDGDIHLTRQEYDEERTAYLLGQGLRVIRMDNKYVELSVKQASRLILSEIRKTEFPSPEERERGQG